MRFAAASEHRDTDMSVSMTCCGSVALGAVPVGGSDSFSLPARRALGAAAVPVGRSDGGGATGRYTPGSGQNLWLLAMWIVASVTKVSRVVLW